MTNVILASQSPRRQDILRQVHIPFTVRIAHVDESVITETNPIEKVRALASLKNNSVSIKNDEIVIAADTIVCFNGKVLEKPRGKNDAVQMLRMLSGKEHSVYTGVSLRTMKEEETFVEETRVTFFSLKDAEIDAYIASGEPFDKAGAYGIQGLGATLVKEVHGDYFNVVGLPIARVVRKLRAMSTEM